MEVKCGNLTEAIGLLFQIQGANPTPELWEQCKQTTIGEIKKQPLQDLTFGNYPYAGDYSYKGGFYTIVMPCGSVKSFRNPKDIMDLPIEDIPCGCGDKSYWFVRFKSFN